MRALLINGYEADRRHEFEEIIGDFPKLNDQKQLTIISELNATIDKITKKSIDSDHSPKNTHKEKDSIWKRRAEFLQAQTQKKQAVVDLNNMLKSPEAEDLKKQFKIKDLKPLTVKNNFMKNIYISSKINDVIQRLKTPQSVDLSQQVTAIEPFDNTVSNFYGTRMF